MALAQDQEIRRLIEIRVNADQAVRELQKLNRTTDELSRSVARSGQALRGMDDAMKGLRNLGSAFVGISAFQQVIALTLRFRDAMVELNREAQTFGVSIERWQTLQQIARETGVPIGDITNAMESLTERIGDTARGVGEGVDAFKYLGISVKDSQGNLKSAENVLVEVTGKLASLKDETTASALAQKLLGDAGARLVPIMDKLALSAQKEAEYRERGLIVTRDQAKAWEELNGRLQTAGQIVSTSLNPVFEELFRLLVAAAEAAANLTQNLADALLSRPGRLPMANLEEAKRAVESYQTQLDEAQKTLDHFNSMSPGTGGFLNLMSDQREKVIQLTDALQNARKAVEAFERPAVTAPKGAWGAFNVQVPKTAGPSVESIAEMRREFELLQESSAKSLADVNQQIALITSGQGAQLEQLQQGAKTAQEADKAAEKMYEAGRRLVELRKISSEDLDKAVAQVRAETRAREDGLFLIREYEEAQKRATAIIDQSQDKTEDWKDTIAEAVAITEKFPDLITPEQLEKIKQFQAGTKQVNKDLEEMKDAVETALIGSFTELAQTLAQGTFDFHAFATSVLQDITQIVIRLSVVLAMQKAVNAAFGDQSMSDPSTSSAGVGLWQSIAKALGGSFAKGGIFANGMPLTAFAGGGVLTQPVLFPMANGMGLAGEAGPEAIMPLKRGMDGTLGVSGGGTIVNIMAPAGAETEARSRKTAAGETIIDVMIADRLQKILGSGKLDRNFGAIYGLKRVGR